MASSAAHILRRYLAKAAGDRGGHVIGTTASGKPIYASTKADSAVYHDLTARDHASAATFHDREASVATDRKTVVHHESMASAHRIRYEQVREKQGLTRAPAGAGTGGRKVFHDEPALPHHGAEVGKVFSGRAIHANKQPHEYKNFTAAEHGEASQIHAAAAARARTSGDHEGAAAHGAMRYAHVQATIAHNRAEATLRGHDRPHYQRQQGGRTRPSAYA